MLEEYKTPDFFRRYAIQKSITDVFFWFRMYFAASRFYDELEDRDEEYWREI